MLVSTPPGCTTDSFTGLFAIASSCRRLSEKPRTANFAAAYAVWPGGAMMPKSEERTRRRVPQLSQIGTEP